MNFRDITLGASTIRLMGLIHASSGVQHLQSNLRTILDFKPDVFFVETSKKSLELSEFVWNTRDKSCTVDKFCREESYVNDTLAIAARHELGSTAPIIPVDIDPSVTRRRLAKSALFHPIESLILISRYHGKSNAVSSLEEVGRWRSQFRTSCPHAFDILFTSREQHMCNGIRSRISHHPERAMVLVGLSHVDALYDSLV